MKFRIVENDDYDSEYFKSEIDEDDAHEELYASFWYSEKGNKVVGAVTKGGEMYSHEDIWYGAKEYTMSDLSEEEKKQFYKASIGGSTAELYKDDLVDLARSYGWMGMHIAKSTIYIYRQDVADYDKEILKQLFSPQGLKYKSFSERRKKGIDYNYKNTLSLPQQAAYLKELMEIYLNDDTYNISAPPEDYMVQFYYFDQKEDRGFTKTYPANELLEGTESPKFSDEEINRDVQKATTGKMSEEDFFKMRYDDPERFSQIYRDREDLSPYQEAVMDFLLSVPDKRMVEMIMKGKEILEHSTEKEREFLLEAPHIYVGDDTKVIDPQPEAANEYKTPVWNIIQMINTGHFQYRGKNMYDVSDDEIIEFIEKLKGDPQWEDAINKFEEEVTIYEIMMKNFNNPRAFMDSARLGVFHGDYGR